MKYRQTWLIVITCASLLLTTCTADPLKLFSKAAPVETKCPIRIGIITSLTGRYQSQGEEQMRGYMMARDEINEKGGILGCWVELLVKDDTSTNDQAARVVREMTDVDHLPLIIGSYSSDATLQAVGVANAYQIPFLVPSASSDFVTTRGYKWVFRLNAPSSDYAAAALDFVTQKFAVPNAIISIVFEETLFGESASVEAARGSLSRQFDLWDYEAFASGTQDYKKLLEYVKESNPDVVYLVSNSVADAILLMQQSKQVDLNPKLYVGHAGGFANPDFVLKAGKNAEYIVITTQWTPDVKWPGAAEFTKAFINRFGHEPDMRAAMSYATLLVARDAIERAAQKAQQKGNVLNWSDPATIGDVRLALRDALKETNMPQTLIGPIKFDETGQNPHPVLLAQVIDGKLVAVYPDSYKSRDPVIPVPSWKERPQ